MFGWNNVGCKLDIAGMQSRRARDDHPSIIEIRGSIAEKISLFKCYVDFALFQITKLIHDSKKGDSLRRRYSCFVLEQT